MLSSSHHVILIHLKVLALFVLLIGTFSSSANDDYDFLLDEEEGQFPSISFSLDQYKELHHLSARILMEAATKNQPYELDSYEATFYSFNQETENNYLEFLTSLTIEFEAKDKFLFHLNRVMFHCFDHSLTSCLELQSKLGRAELQELPDEDRSDVAMALESKNLESFVEMFATHNPMTLEAAPIPGGKRVAISRHGNPGVEFYMPNGIRRGRRWHLCGTERTIWRIKQAGIILKAKNITMGVGDISLPGNQRTPHHKEHQDGQDIDLRLVNSRGRTGPCTIRLGCYSREKTFEVIKALIDVDPTKIEKILFNDTVLNARINKYYRDRMSSLGKTPRRWSLSIPSSGHSDHIHVSWKSYHTPGRNFL